MKITGEEAAIRRERAAIREEKRRSSVRTTENAAGTAEKEKDQLKTLPETLRRNQEGQRCRSEWSFSPYYAAGGGTRSYLRYLRSARKWTSRTSRLWIMPSAERIFRFRWKNGSQGQSELPFVDRRFRNRRSEVKKRWHLSRSGSSAQAPLRNSSGSMANWFLPPEISRKIWKQNRIRPKNLRKNRKIFTGL